MKKRSVSIDFYYGLPLYLIFFTIVFVYTWIKFIMKEKLGAKGAIKLLATFPHFLREGIKMWSKVNEI